MKISELIAKLEAMKAEHGDLLCITPGFDEANYDTIATITTMSVRLDAVKTDFWHHWGVHVEAKEGGTLVLYIDR